MGPITSAILFGALKLVTGSIWLPMLLLHIALNALTLPMFSEGFIAFGAAVRPFSHSGYVASWT